MMRKLRKLLLFLMALLVIISLSACSKSKAPPEENKIPNVGVVKLNPHPTSLEGKTVVLRWNGKFNGDNLLSQVGQLLTERVKGVKIIKMWEVDRDTAVISDNLEKSDKITSQIAEQKPDIVIAAQAD